MSIFILAIGSFILVSNKSEVKKEAVTESIENVPDGGEDISNYFNVSGDNKESVEPVLTPFSSAISKCRIKSLEVDAGTVIDDSTCVVN
ncbi:MAG: hypothetical protein US39_C0001G0090 [Microgenomates group bacterium GW2011_GWC1_37_12b]|nr:MAG: hypothetical protein US39_C0001G0090 [Microgenomates group bacterium GW2011_GWC1_37_12b]